MKKKGIANMEINISNEQVERLVEKAVDSYVGKRIEQVMNDGKAYWFSQQNIENITRDVILRRITSETIQQICDSLKTDEFIHRLSDCVAGNIRDYLFE